MSIAKKIWIIIAAALILIGAISFVIIMFSCDWNFLALSTVKYQTTEYEISDDFTDISITADTEHITVLPSTDGKCRIVCYLDERAQHSVCVNNGVLSIAHGNMKKWYDYISAFNFEYPRITVYLPSDEYNNIVIDSHTGDINIKNIFVGTLDIEVSTGEVKVENVVCAKDLKLVVSTGDANLVKVRCNNLISVGDTGDLVMDDVWAADKLDIVRDTGDVTFNLCDASEVEIVTSTGDVTGVFIRDMMIFANTSMGKIDVPNINSGGRCEITTDTGDI